MEGFSFNHACKMDEKGRVMLPSRLKATLPEDTAQRIYLVKDSSEPCLTFYPLDEWMKLYQVLKGMNPYNRKQKMFLRSFMSRVTEVEMDKNGRFLIPKALQQHARLEHEITLVGMFGSLEVWNPSLLEMYNEKWEEENPMAEEEFLGDLHLLPQAGTDAMLAPQEVKDERLSEQPIIGKPETESGEGLPEQVKKVGGSGSSTPIKDIDTGTDQ